MSFDIKDKVALITGGASGIGFTFAVALLKEGLRGVTLADINSENGIKAVRDIEKKFGIGRAIFVQTDVTDRTRFDNAFQKTSEAFGNVDILINSAGIFDDSQWEREIAINLNGTINGMFLGMETYLPKWRSSDSETSVIVNVSSVAGVTGGGYPFPVYTATKHAIVGLSRAWGAPFHYDRTKIRVLTICPGLTETPILEAADRKCINAEWGPLLKQMIEYTNPQKSECVASALITLVKTAKTATTWVVDNGKPPYEFVMPDYKSFAPEYNHNQQEKKNI